MDHDSIVNDWKQNAEAHDEENYEFLSSLKFEDYGFDPDTLAAQLHEQAFQVIDCVRCANCCKTTDIEFSHEDVQRAARHLNVTPKVFAEIYLVPTGEDEEAPYKARQTPCPLLGEDNRCTIYDARPSVCREYPHTDKEGFASRRMGHAGNALICPAVFWIVDRMKHEAGWRRR